MWKAVIAASVLGVGWPAGDAWGPSQGDTAGNGVMSPYTRKEGYPIGDGVEISGSSISFRTISTYQCADFSDSTDQLAFNAKVPEDWDGASDMAVLFFWVVASGTPIADTETVVWDLSYRSKTFGELTSDGTLVTETYTHTQSGAGTNKTIENGTVTLDYDDVNQPLAAGDCVGILVARGAGGTYAGTSCLLGFMIQYTSNNVPL